MTAAKYEELIKKALYQVAPDIEGLDIEPDVTFRDQFEIDSMDNLNFIIALSKATNLDIPEADYSQLQTFSGCQRYLAARLGV